MESKEPWPNSVEVLQQSGGNRLLATVYGDTQITAPPATPRLLGRGALEEQAGRARSRPGAA